MSENCLPDYIIADPTGNITALVTSPVPMEEQTAAAELIFTAEPTVEQVGFLRDIVPGRSAAIRMSGGEFCGNASLSAAAYVLQLGKLDSGTVTLDFFGLPEPVSVFVEKQPDGSFRGAVSMPLPESVTEEKLQFGDLSLTLPVVNFPGISHIILEQPLEKAVAEAAVKKWCGELGVPALGLIQLDLNSDRLTPLVYVREVNSLYWESSCASGTCAAARVLFHKDGSSFRSFTEPGGSLSAEVSEDSLKLLGSVQFR